MMGVGGTVLKMAVIMVFFYFCGLLEDVEEPLSEVGTILR
jgi:hypothetical protein